MNKYRDDLAAETEERLAVVSKLKGQLEDLKQEKDQASDTLKQLQNKSERDYKTLKKQLETGASQKNEQLASEQALVAELKGKNNIIERKKKALENRVSTNYQREKDICQEIKILKIVLEKRFQFKFD